MEEIGSRCKCVASVRAAQKIVMIAIVGYPSLCMVIFIDWTAKIGNQISN